MFGFEGTEQFENSLNLTQTLLLQSVVRELKQIVQMDLQVVGSADFDQDAQKVYPFLYKLLVAEFLLGCLVPQLTNDLVKLHMIVAAKHTSRNPHKHVVEFVDSAPTSKVNGIVLVEVTVLGKGLRELQDALQHYLHVALEEPQYLIFLHREQLLQ